MKFKSIMKKCLGVGLTGTMVFGLAACGSQKTQTTGDSTSSKESVTLEFQQWWEGELPKGVLRSISDDFTKETGINIKLLSNPYADTKTQVAAGAAAGTMADVVGLDGAWVYDFAKQGSIENLTALMKTDKYDDSQISSQVKVDGNTYMIPVVNFAYPMYVNMDLLKAAGINEVPKTWTEFQAACKKVTNSQKNIYGWIIPLASASPSGVQNCFMSWLWASGGTMLKDGKPNLTGNDKLTKTVDFVKSLFKDGVVTPGAYSMTEADEVEEFANGRVAFMIDSLAHLTTIKKSAPNMNIAFMSIPKMDGYTGQSGMDVANWGIGISSNSKHKTEALKFIEYLMSAKVNAQLAVAANAFPGNKTANPDYSSADKLFVDAYNIYKGSYAINEFTGLPTSEELMRQFDKQLQLYYEGTTASSDKMLSEVQKEWEPAFK
jgi:multiple sugar transport system substrate-binding protein